jgi:hypothetical protein
MDAVRRRGADSNRCAGLCRPLPNLSATAPGALSMLSGHEFAGRRLERRRRACAECWLVGWRGPCPGVDGASFRLEPRPPTGAPLSRHTGRPWFFAGRSPAPPPPDDAPVRLEKANGPQAPGPERAGAARGGGRSASGGRPVGSRRWPRQALRSGRGAANLCDAEGRRLDGCRDARLLDGPARRNLPLWSHLSPTPGS